VLEVKKNYNGMFSKLFCAYFGYLIFWNRSFMHKILFFVCLDMFGCWVTWLVVGWLFLRGKVVPRRLAFCVLIHVLAFWASSYLGVLLVLNVIASSMVMIHVWCDALSHFMMIHMMSWGMVNHMMMLYGCMYVCMWWWCMGSLVTVRPH